MGSGQLMLPGMNLTTKKLSRIQACPTLCNQCQLRKEIRLLHWQVRELITQLQSHCHLFCDGDTDHA